MPRGLEESGLPRPRHIHPTRLMACTAAIFVAVAGWGIALACRCTEPGPRQAYGMAQSVVYGRVVSAKKENDGGDISYVFEVAESWKQSVESQITVHTGTTCSFEATVGERYVLFLKQQGRSFYETASCMGNRPDAKARALLSFLRGRAKQQPRR